MNNRKPNTQRVKLEARPRSHSSKMIGNSYNAKNRQRDETVSNKFLVKTAICVVILLGVYFLNNLEDEFSKGLTSDIGKAISYQTQWNELLKGDMVALFEEKVSTFIGGKEVAVFSDGFNEPFQEPVSGHLTSEFEEKVHPVFNTKIEPRGIEYSIFQTQGVLASMDGIVLDIMDSTYQGKRVVVQHQNQYKTVYDGIEDVHVEEGQSITKGQELGTIQANEEMSKLLFFEVWKDNTAVNPTELFQAEKQ